MATLRGIVQNHFEAYAATHAVSVPQRRAAWALSSCRTAGLGAHVQRCPEGHVERVWYHSCRHRACPQCNALARAQWLERTRARLLDCAHHHIIFTIPHELNILWRLNGAAMMTVLFAAATAMANTARRCSRCARSSSSGAC